MRRAALSVLCAVALAGCGGGSSGSATGGPSGAEIAPAQAIAFVAINTDRSSDQWTRADELLRKFQFRDELLSRFNRSLSKDVDFGRDVLPVAGDELDVVVVQAAGEHQVVGLAQPTDEQRFNATLKQGAEPALHKKVGEWTVFSDSQAALDVVTGNGDSLADADAFADAMAELPEEANAKAYVEGGKLAEVLRARLPQAQQAPAGDLSWLSLALSSHDEGWKLDGAAKTKGAERGETFEPTLFDRVPAGALLVASFKGGEDGLRELRDTPGAQEGIAQLQQALGVSVEQLAQLISDESVLFVQKNAPFPEVTLIMKEDDTREALATLNTLARRASTFLGARLTTRGSVKKLSFGRFAVFYGAAEDDTVVVSNTSAALARDVSSSIGDDPVFGDAKGAAEVPDDVSALLYVNVKDAVPMLESLALATGETLPPDFRQNVAPLQSFIAYGAADGDIGRFSALLQVR